MSKSRQDKSRQLAKKPSIDEFWNIDYFRDFEKWVKYWKPLVTIYENKDDRVLAKKAQRYDDLWEAHVALMNDKCPTCTKVDEISARVESLEEKLATADEAIKLLESEKKQLTDTVADLEKQLKKTEKDN